MKNASLPSKKQIKTEREHIDSLGFEELYDLYKTWPMTNGLSKTAHFPYVKIQLYAAIKNMAPEDYKEFLHSKAA